MSQASPTKLRMEGANAPPSMTNPAILFCHKTCAIVLYDVNGTIGVVMR